MRGVPGPQPDESAIAALDDRARIVETGCRFLLALDMRRWDEALACCASDIAVVWEVPGRARLDSRGGDAVAALQASLGAASHHQATNFQTEFDGADARLRWYVTGRYRTPTMRGSDACAVFGEQTMTLRRAGGDWRIADIRHTIQWIEGNPAVPTATPGAAPAPAQLAFVPTSPPGEETPAQRLARLADRDAIHDVMMRFGRGLDRKDWALYRSCFGKTLTLDFSRMTGEPAQEVDADLFVDFARLRQRSHLAFHQYANFQVAIDGNRAACVLSMVARHRIAESDSGGPLNVFVGWYDNEFVRGPDGWVISVLRTPLQWVEGNASIKDAPDPEAEEASRRLFEPREPR